MVKCPVCGGLGELESFEIHEAGGRLVEEILFEPCDHCDGTGEVVESESE